MEIMLFLQRACGHDEPPLLADPVHRRMRPIFGVRCFSTALDFCAVFGVRCFSTALDFCAVFGARCFSTALVFHRRLLNFVAFLQSFPAALQLCEKPLHRDELFGRESLKARDKPFSEDVISRHECRPLANPKRWRNTAHQNNPNLKSLSLFRLLLIRFEPFSASSASSLARIRRRAVSAYSFITFSAGVKGFSCTG